MAQSAMRKVKKMIVAVVEFAGGPGTTRSIKGKAKGLAGTGASRIARAAAAAAVRLEAEGQADAIAGRRAAEAAGALTQPHALKSAGRAQPGTARPEAKK